MESQRPGIDGDTLIIDIYLSSHRESQGLRVSIWQKYEHEESRYMRRRLTRHINMESRS